MRTLIHPVVVSLCCLALAGVGPVRAGGLVVALRVSSLDALLADSEAIARANGEDELPDALLDDALRPFGLSDSDWIDGSRPLVVGLPPEGLVNMGWLGAIPVAETESALALLDRMLVGGEATGEIRSYSTPFGPPVFVAPADRYLIVGLNRDLVRGADLDELLDLGELPPGSIAFDVELLPLTPMIQLGLAAGRQSVQNDLGDASAEAAQAMIDLYLETLNNVLLNTRRLQASIEIAAGTMIVHERLLPRSGSTFEGWLAAQGKSFPDLARRVDPGESIGVFAGEMAYTPQLRAALKHFVQGYMKAIEALAESPESEADEMLGALLEPWAESAERWVDCVRGDHAGFMELGAERGFRVVQLAGMNDAESCGGLIDDLTDMVGQIAEASSETPGISVTPVAFSHAGVDATRIAVPLPQADEPGGSEGETDDPVADAVLDWFGDGVYEYFLGMSGDVLVSTAGSAADESFRAVVERLATRKKKGGITPEMFAPLAEAPGLYAAFDFGAMMRAFAELDPDDEELQALGALGADAGRAVFGLRLLDDSLDLDIALPLAALQALSQLDDGDEADTDADDREPDTEPSATDASDRS